MRAGRSRRGSERWRFTSEITLIANGEMLIEMIRSAILISRDHDIHDVEIASGIPIPNC